MIAVTFALPAESSRFLRRLGNKSRSDHNGIRVTRGEIDSHRIEVLHTGVGETVCRERIAVFLRDSQFKYLISAGFAGALNDQLHVGDVLLAKNFSTLTPGKSLLNVRGSVIHSVDLVTVPSMVDSAEERERIAQATHAGAIDMETEFIARACAERALPLLPIRVISDTPSAAFPAPGPILFDFVKQRTSFTRLSAFLSAHPARIPHLIRFARRIARAKKTLATVLVDIIREL